MLFLLKSFLREIIFRVHTEYSHASFVSDKTSEKSKNFEYKSYLLLFLLKGFLSEIIFRVHTEYSHASFVSDKTSEKVKIVSTKASCKNHKCYFCLKVF